MNKIALTGEPWSISVIVMIQAASRDLILDGWGGQIHSPGWSFELEVKVEVAGSLVNFQRR